MTQFELIAMGAKIAFVLGVVLGIVPMMIWFERRGAAWIQGRVGPNRVGPFGLLQSLADVGKLVFKESFIPKDVSKFFYLLAPEIALFSPMAALAVIPFGSHLVIQGQVVNLQMADLNLGLLFVFAIAGLEVYSIMLAGWSSNNKYAVLGALRGSSQVVSYEIAMGLSIVSMLLIYGNVSMREIVAYQNAELFGVIPRWGIFVNPVAAIVFWVAIFAETNRLPFDLPEGEAELVAGYHVEYASVKFALFFMAEYVAMAMASGLLVTLFLGGYNLLPGMNHIVEFIVSHWSLGSDGAQNALAGVQILSFLIKAGFIMFVYVWVRWTLPRFRFDQLMDLGWKRLLPLSFVNLIIVACALYWLEAHT